MASAACCVDQTELAQRTTADSCWVAQEHDRVGQDLWTPLRGFLPIRDPLVWLDAPYEVLLALTARMPAALADGSFRCLVDNEAGSLKEVESAVRCERSQDVMERVHSLLGYIGKGYVHGAAEQDGACRVPTFLSGPWRAVADKLQRHPTIDYASTVLYNWQRIDKDGPFVPDNIRILNKFTGLIDEEWFLKTHVIIEAEASHVVSAILVGFEATKEENVPKLLEALSCLEKALSHVASNCLQIMFHRDEDNGNLCEPHMFFHRIRTYLGSWKAVFDDDYENMEELDALRVELATLEDGERNPDLPDLAFQSEVIHAKVASLQKRRSLNGPSGAMSTILPLCDAFVGIGMSSQELGKMLAGFEEYMPSEHRRVLGLVRQHPARHFVLRLLEQGDAQAEALKVRFNACVRCVLDFRWRHLSYIESYVLKPSGSSNTRGTGGTPAFAYLHQHLDDTEAALIADAPSCGTLVAASKPTCWPPQQLPEALARPSDALWGVTEACGLLPSRRPLNGNDLPDAWADARLLLQKLPSACVPPANFRPLVERFAKQLPNPHDCSELTTDQQERARAIIAFLVAGCLAEKGEVPETLTSLFAQLSKMLNRQPQLGTPDLILGNWHMEGHRAKQQEPRAKRQMLGHPQLGSMEKVQPLQRFLCVEEEDWFYRLHVTLAAEMGPVVCAIRHCIAAQSAVEMVQAFQKLEKAIRRLVQTHESAGIGCAPGQTAPEVRPALLWRRLRRFLLPRTRDPILEAAWVYCATGIDQLCMMHVLGVEQGTHAIQRFREQQQADLPRAHWAYLAQLQAHASMREKVEVAARSLSIQELARLELAHNSCIDMLMLYFDGRIGLVRAMLGENALKQAWEMERGTIKQAQLQLLIERRVATQHP